jgi:peptide deformylase
MSVLPIYTYGAPVLRKKARPLTSVDANTIKFIMDMFQTMHGAQGIGLAATQVGSLDRIIVLDISDVEEYKDVKPMTLINPEVIRASGVEVMEEGCLSLPEVRDEVERAGSITVRFKDAGFATQELDASGLLARVLLHEIDHLDGVLFIDRLPDAARKLHKDALRQIQRGEMEVPYPVVTAVDIAV